MNGIETCWACRGRGELTMPMRRVPVGKGGSFGIGWTERREIVCGICGGSGTVQASEAVSA